MNGLLGRTRRVLAGLVSAMMVLTSLPMTGVAVYAAPSGNAVEEASDTAEAADVAVADVDEAAEADAADAAVEEADDTATAEDAAQVTLSFNRYGEGNIKNVRIGDKVLTFTGQTVSENVSANVTYKIQIGLDESDTSSFVYAAGYVEGHAGVALDRDETDPYTTFVLTPTEGMGIGIYLQEHTVSVNDPDATANYTSGVENGGDDHFIVPGEDIVFTLSNVPDKYVSYDVSAKGGETELEVTKDSGNYTISKNEVKKAVFAEENIEISVDGLTYTTDRIQPNPNEDLEDYTEDRDSLVSENSVVYVKRDKDYRFKATLTPASVSAGKIVSKVSYQIGTNTPVEVTADGDGWYTIPAEHILTAAQQDKNISIDFVTAAAKQNVNFKANEFVKEISYGTAGDEKNVDMAKARTASGDSVSQDNADFKVIVTPSENALLLSDSFKVGGVAVEAEDVGTTYSTYSVSANEAGSVDIDVNAYKKVGVSANNLLSKKGSELVTIGDDIQGVTSGLTNGDAITFTYGYASDCSDYDVTLAAPVVKYGDTAITPEHSGSGIEGTYTIKKSDVEAAIKAGKNIVIEAKGTEIEKVKFTLTKDIGVANVRYFELDKKGEVKKDGGLDSVWTTVSGNIKKTEVEAQKGNAIWIYDIVDAETGNKRFKKVSRDGSEIRSGSKLIEGVEVTGYSLGAVEDGETFDIRTADLRASEVRFVIDGNTETISYNMVASDDLWNENNSVARFTATAIDDDLINNYKLSDVKYEVTGGSKGSLAVSSGLFGLSDAATKEAAFAEPDTDGIKLTITAKVVKAGTKPQYVEIVDPDNGVEEPEIVQNGARVTELKYGAAAKFTVKPKTGYELDKVYLIKDEDIKSASLNSADHDYATKLQEKVTASQNGIKSKAFSIGADGTATASVANVEGWYTVLAITNAKEELIIEEDSHDGWRAIPASDHTYNVSWGRKYRLYIQSGSDKVSLSKNSISVNYTDGKGGTVPPSVLTYPDEDPLTEVIFFNGEAVEGRTVMIKLGSVAPVFSVAKKPTEDSLKFADGVVSWNAAVSRNEIIESQPLGTSRTYRLSVGPEIAGLVGTNMSELRAAGVKVGLKDITDRNGKITGIDMTVTSEPVSDLRSADIKFHDASAYPLHVFKTVTVKFSTDQVKNADITGVTAKADTDSITVDFREAKGFDKSTEGLYYKVSISTSDNSTALWDEGDGTKTVMVPVTETSRKISLAKGGADDVEANVISYTVEVELVQVSELNEDGTYNSSKKIEGSSVKTIRDERTKTIADGVYATQIKLIKSKAAPKKIYGSSEDGVGMGEFLLATVQYPNAAKNTSVTVQRLKAVELIDSKGTVVDTAADGVYIREERNNIYLNTKGLEKGKYTVKAYAIEPKGIDVTSSLKVNVLNAIHHIEVNATPGYRIYKAPGKAATVKLTAVYNRGEKTDAPATKKVKWSFATDNVPAGVTLKNGKLTIGKNVMLPIEDLKIVATAADFAGNGVKNDETVIEVVSEPQAPAEIRINGVPVKDGDELKSDDLVAFSAYDEAGNEIGATFKATGALKNGKWGPEFSKFGTAKITATANDGSKKKKTVKINVVTDSGINGSLGAFIDDLDFDSNRNAYSFINTSSAAVELPLSVEGDSGSAVKHSLKLSGFSKVKLKGAPYGYYQLLPTKRGAKITIKETATGKSTVINVTNTAFPAGKKAAATKVTASNKLYTAVGAKKITENKGTIFGDLAFEDKDMYNRVSYNKVTYTVKYGKKAAPEGDLVRVYPATNGKDDGRITELLEANGFAKKDDAFEVKLGKGGTFVIDYVDATGKSGIPKGTYRLQITPVDKDGNALCKTANIKLKVVNTPKASAKTIKAKTVNFTSVSADVVFGTLKNVAISPVDNSPVDLFLGGMGDVWNTRGINQNGKINGFATMFTVDKPGTGSAKLKYNGTPSEFYDTNKGIKGYVLVSYVAMNGEPSVMYVPVTVKGNFQ